MSSRGADRFECGRQHSERMLRIRDSEHCYVIRSIVSLEGGREGGREGEREPESERARREGGTDGRTDEVGR